MQAPRIIVATLATGLALAIAVFIALKVRQNDRANLLTDDPRVLQLGAAVYQQRCAACHGAKLEGQANWRERGGDGVLPAPPHDASGHTWHHPDDVLFRITKYGVAKVANMPNYQSDMPPFEGVLTDAEIVAALSWIRAQWPEYIRSEQQKIDKQYRTKQGS